MAPLKDEPSGGAVPLRGVDTSESIGGALLVLAGIEPRCAALAPPLLIASAQDGENKDVPNASDNLLAQSKVCL